jgi:hypothetical protein
MGQPLTETIDALCHCGGEFVEAEKCPVCGEWFDNTNMNGVCEVCVEACETVGEALAIGAENTESVDGINGFVASVLSVEQINKILTKWVEENFTDHSKDVVKYCEEDKMYFADWISDKYGENK